MVPLFFFMYRLFQAQVLRLFHVHRPALIDQYARSVLHTNHAIAWINHAQIVLHRILANAMIDHAPTVRHRIHVNAWIDHVRIAHHHNIVNVMINHASTVRHRIRVNASITHARTVPRQPHIIHPQPATATTIHSATTTAVAAMIVARHARVAHVRIPAER